MSFQYLRSSPILGKKRVLVKANCDYKVLCALWAQLSELLPSMMA
jgi:hypothetical protein